ncbi:MAG: 4-alpha-glucanotransferase [Candidatus Eremiobacteraeota bacterium]|nr:4-alpha-glucanotransferase [Candidatus Eremiobacteraeota bacterium]
MTSLSSAVERLARLAQVRTSYDDVRGVTQAAKPESIRALLAVLGFDASSDAEATRTAEELELRPWRQPLEPVYVLDAGRACEIALSMRADGSAETASWELTSENGDVTRGSVELATLPILETRSIEGVSYERRALALEPSPAEPGYYALTVRLREGVVRTTVALVPPTCWMPEAVAERGVWGLAIQLYALRSKRNWGIGDFTDLRELCASVRAAGGAAVGLSPLHVVRFGASGAPSPYSPSSRLFLNWIYLDVEALPGFDAADVDVAALAEARANELVDYATVAALKRAAARAAFDRYSADAAGRAPLDAFVAAGGEALQRAATFDALERHFARTPGAERWDAWPAPFRDPASAEVATFARAHSEDVAFFAFLQWQADVQLRACRSEAELRIGLYCDLAVGADTAGSDTWSERSLVREAAVGAPPDVLNVRGQNWGVAPFDPLALRDAAYAPFVDLLRANMRHAGALRIDHVMALARLYWVPAGRPATDGAYVSYRLRELLGIVALESRRAKCMVIGEDLGTVPAGFREQLAERGLLSYRLLQFEVDDTGFSPPSAYPSLARVSIGTHDLPPMAAYWTGSDIGLRARLGLIAGSDAERSERDERSSKRERLLEAFEIALDLDTSQAQRFRAAANSSASERAALAELALCANRFLAKTPGRLLMVALEDVFGDGDQVNVPTTLDEHPNWRRRASVELELLAADPRFVALARALRRERGSVYDSSSENDPSL